MSSSRRRPKAKTTEAVMQFVEAEVAKVVASDPGIEAARLRAARRAGGASRRAATRELTLAH